ncbi:heme/hemin ABC transporter substrate-binding protein [Roseobacter sinensis]|uniref:ABC transporter substrate-binding protein n=1 Tax=Roseobacter sinensis TaxID=2931391 RepID=A0ABT3BKB0_9RHOB|nr:ABC transporter substrate-binding protein [Roseobacter sp. WL0113]MCV3274005.1 ABC transporter substrate-binding protein [Roseobacter sp. WL0113]
MTRRSYRGDPGTALAGQVLRAVLILLALGLAMSPAQANGQANRVVSLGGSVTEIVFALGEEHRLVGRDTTSSFPAAAEDLPDVGYIRALSPEGVLSIQPDLILSEEGAGPPDAVDLLKSAQIPFVEMPQARTAEQIAEKINAVGAALGVPQKASALAERVLAEVQATTDSIAASDQPRPRVLFLLSTEGGRLMASGAETSADAIIALAGGDNAIDTFDGYKAVTAEAIATAAPDVILMMDRAGDHASTDAELFAMPALRTTPAAQAGAVVRMNGLLLLGFGPRTAEAVRTLHDALYPAG